MKPYFLSFVKKLGIPEEALADLSAMFGLGEPSKVALPKELLPIGAKLVAKGLWNTIFSGLSDNYVLPFWMEKQFRLSSPSFIPRSHNLTAINSTHRNWTGLGLPYLPRESIIDPKGLITPRANAYSLDTMLSCKGKSFFPSQSARVNQQLVEGAPVVQTSYAFQGIRVQQTDFVSMINQEGWLLHTLSLGNNTQQRINGTCAVVVRPFNVEGMIPLQEFTYMYPFVRLNEMEEIVLLDQPTRVVASNYKEGDICALLQESREQERDSHCCPHHLLTVAFLYDFSLQKKEKKQLSLLCRLSPSDRIVLPENISVEGEKRKILGYWKKKGDQGIQLQTPLPALNRSFQANKNFLAMLVDKGAITPGVLTYHHFWFRDAAYQIPALDKVGFLKESRSVLETYPRRQRRDGFFISQDGEWDSNGEALYTLVHHYLYTRDKAYLQSIFPSIKKGIAWIWKTIEPKPYGLLPAGFSTEHGGPNDIFFWDDFWAIGGIDSAVEAALELQEVDLARSWQRRRKHLWNSLVKAMKHSSGARRNGIVGGSPTRFADGAVITNLCSVYPLQVLPAEHPVVKRWVRFLIENYCQKGVYYHPIIHSGLNIYLSLQLAQVLLRQGDPLSWDIFMQALSLATKTFTYPEAIHPFTKGGCMGDGHHGWAVAEILHFVRSLFFIEYRDALHLLPILPQSLLSGLSLKNAPSRFGKIGLDFKGEKKTWELSLETDFTHPPNYIQLNLPQQPKIVEADGEGWEKKKTLVLPSTLRKLKIAF